MNIDIYAHEYICVTGAEHQYNSMSGMNFKYEQSLFFTCIK